MPEQRRSLAGRFRPAPPQVQEQKEEEEEEAEYHIEIAPGQWVTTSNETEARLLLDMQRVAEENFGEVVTDETEEGEAKEMSEEAITLPVEDLDDSEKGGENDVNVSREGDSAEEKNKSAFKKRITECLFNPRDCRF